MLTLSTLLLTLPAAALAAPQAGSAAPGGDGHEAQIFHQITHGPGGATSGPCERQAWAERKAAHRAAQADFIHALALCVNISEADDRWDCVLDAFDELDEALALLQEQFLARLDLCLELDGGTYEPEIDPDDFVDLIDNPFLPLIPGTTRVYEKDTDEGQEVIHVETTDETREILGVECAVILDTVWLEGELAEKTYDYFAQDEDGNVWYFGEVAINYEDGEIANLDGSWIAGQDGAQAGIVMYGDLAAVVGTTYRQEYLLGEAEDVATLLALDATADVPFGNYAGCAKTLDFSPLDPGVEEEKYYAAGVGVVLEVDLETGERLELVDVLTD